MLAVQVQYLQYAEGKRHNLVTEQLGYDNLAETHRSNVVRETQEWTRIDQNQQQINENIRHNKVSENISLISANAQAMNAQTNRMLADAQVPLMEAQKDKTEADTDFIGKKIDTEKNNTNVAAATAKIQETNADWAFAKNFAEIVNNIVPF